MLFWGEGLESEKMEVQQDERGVLKGSRSGVGSNPAHEGQRRPLSRHSEVWMVDWKAGKPAGKGTNGHGCSLTFLIKPP